MVGSGTACNTGRLDACNRDAIPGVAAFHVWIPPDGVSEMDESAGTDSLALPAGGYWIIRWTIADIDWPVRFSTFAACPLWPAIWVGLHEGRFGNL